MRALGKVMWGAGSVLALYFCAQILGIALGRGKNHASNDAPDEMPPVASSGATLTSLVTRHSEPRPAERPPSAPSAVKANPVAPEGARGTRSEESHELTAALETQFAGDARPTQESSQREKTIGGFFSTRGLDGKGRLEELSCREKICRGVIRIANEGADREVFNRTFLSTEFMMAVPDAISVASREKASDGSILATFFIHPQSVFGMVPHEQSE
jgi:hypothetical protein